MTPTSAPQLRIGLGYDVHRVGDDRRLMIGGVEIPWDRGLIGHSDADVLLHALTDALLGAAALGDIGQMFPNTDPSNKNRASCEMLAIAIARVRDTGWEIVNIDCVLIAQQPKLAPHVDSIRRRIATILEITPAQVGLKGKTGEHVGPVGRGEAIEAHATALLHKPV